MSELEQRKSRWVAFRFHERKANVEGIYVLAQCGRIYAYGDHAYGNGIYVAPWGRAQQAIQRLQGWGIPFTYAKTNNRDPQAVLALAQKVEWQFPNGQGNF